MNFKPSKQKTIFSILSIIIGYILIFTSASLSQCWCKPCLESFNGINCEKVLIINIIPDTCNCGCGCPISTPINKIISDLAIILLPGILFYLIWSLIQKKK